MFAGYRETAILLVLVATAGAAATEPRFGLPQALNTTAQDDAPAIKPDETGQADSFPRIAIGVATTDNRGVSPGVAGTLLAIWETVLGTGGGRGVIPIFDGFGVDREVVASRSIDEGRTWSDPVPVNDARGDDDQVPAADDVRPTVASDGRGLWVSVWGSRVASVGDTAKGTDSDILVAASRDDGISWGPVHILTPAYATHDGGKDGDGSEESPEIVFVPGASATGAFVTVWYTNAANATNRVLAARSTGTGADGAPTWPECPTVINPHPAPPPAPRPGPCDEVFRLENAADPEIFHNTLPHLATDGRGR